MNYKKIILLVLVGSGCLQAMQLPLMKLSVLLQKGLKDLNNDRGTNELIDLLKHDPRYLTLIDPEKNQSLIDLVIEEVLAARPIGDNKEQLAKFTARENLLTRIIRVGRGNEPFIKLVDQKRQGMLLNEEYYQPILSCFINEFPEMFKAEGRKKAQPARPKNTRSNFVYTEPTPELRKDATVFNKMINDLQRDWIFGELTDFPEDLLFEDPTTGQPLIYFIAHNWKHHPRSQEHTMKAFIKVLNACSKNPLFLWQLKHLLALFKEDEVGYGPLIEELFKATGLVTVEGNAHGDMKPIFGWYKENKFPFKQPEIDQQVINEKRSAVYGALIFRHSDSCELDKIRKLIKRNPVLAQVSNQYGLPLTHALIKKHSEYCANSDSASWAKEIKKVEALFGQLLFAGAPTKTRADRFILQYKNYTYALTKEDYYPSVDELLTHPEVNEFYEGGYKFSHDPDRKVKVPIHPRTKEELGSLLGLNREAFIKKYHWMDAYIPEPHVKESANQSKDSKKASEEGTQPVPSNAQQEPQPTFLDSWKGTLKFLVVGALGGAVLYYGVKRYNSTPEELYSPAKTAVA